MVSGFVTNKIMDWTTGIMHCKRCAVARTECVQFTPKGTAAQLVLTYTR